MNRASAAPTVLITGASTGIGNLVARALARDGYRVYAGMRDVAGRNKKHADALVAFAGAEGLRLSAVELDVVSKDSANSAARTVVEDAGRIDVVVNNAGHLVVGYAEAFTAEDFAHLFDVNVYGVQRVNRAVLPVMRAQGSGVLLYIGSTIPVSSPPFLAPYVASKAASDSLALTTAYEVSQFGVETVIVMPGAFTQVHNTFRTPAAQAMTQSPEPMQSSIRSWRVTRKRRAASSRPEKRQIRTLSRPRSCASSQWRLAKNRCGPSSTSPTRGWVS